VVFVTTPPDDAKPLAKILVDKRLAACVNLIPTVESTFWWDDAVQSDTEAMLICKTTAAKVGELLEYVKDAHPYDLPEAIAVPLSEGLPEYLAWVAKETGESS
jgi:periplasmic divalent cation tolerance protein